MRATTRNGKTTRNLAAAGMLLILLLMVATAMWLVVLGRVVLPSIWGPVVVLLIAVFFVPALGSLLALREVRGR